jgi:TonB family protein
VTPARPVNPEPRIVAEAKPAPAPKPLVKTGSFQDLETAKAAPVPKQVVVGGFGDPRGVQASDTPKPQPVLMARVGGFDNPTGAGQAGGGGHLDSGAVKQSGFGNAGITTNGTNGTQKSQIKTGGFGDGLTAGTAHSGNGVVRSSGFGDTVAAVSPRKEAVAAVAAFTPVEILFKPRPSYSAEARGMRLEGQVSLEVVFQASGAVKVVRVIKGLGHGLDEAAQQAASQVRFKPATRGGAPVDTNATINITFELT